MVYIMATIVCILSLLLSATSTFCANTGESNQTRYAPVKSIQGQFDFYVEENTLNEMKEMKDHIEEKLEENKKYIEKLISTSIVDLTKHVAAQAEEIAELEINVKALRESLADKLDENDRKIVWAITDDSLAPRNTSWVQENLRKQQELLDQLVNNIVPRHCGKVSGVATITPIAGQPSFRAMCLSRDSGNWMVFQRRYDGSLDFYRDWQDYAHGFGDVDGEHWLGLRRLHHLSTHYMLALRVEMISFEEPMTTYYAQYSSFSIGSEEDGFPLSVGGYTGNAGDSLIDNHNGKPFRTQDMDSNGCSVKRHGAWWYSTCGRSNLNGRYSSEVVTYSGGYHQQLFWYSLKRAYKIPLKATTMMVRMV